jgi:hypothetical protein
MRPRELGGGDRYVHMFLEIVSGYQGADDVSWLEVIREKLAV